MISPPTIAFAPLRCKLKMKDQFAGKIMVDEFFIQTADGPLAIPKGYYLLMAGDGDMLPLSPESFHELFEETTPEGMK